MTLLRAAARTMLASSFIASGLKAVRDPAPLVSDAESVTDRLVPLAKQYAPAQVASFIPEDTQTLIRINGAVQIIGGLALASGRGRRLGSFLLAASLIPTTMARHPFWTREDADERATDRSAFLKNVSLLGAVLLAARDTEGQPGLAWRAQRGGHQIAQSTSRASRQVTKKAHDLTGGGNDFADAALASGAALVGTVVATSRRARKKAAAQAKVAKKEAAKLQVVVAKKAAEAKKVAAQQAEKAMAAATAAAKQAKKDAPKQLKAAKKEAQKRAKKRGKNIELGSN